MPNSPSDSQSKLDSQSKSQSQPNSLITPLPFEGTEKVKSTFRLKVNGEEIVVLPFFFCLT